MTKQTSNLIKKISCDLVFVGRVEQVQWGKKHREKIMKQAKWNIEVLSGISVPLPGTEELEITCK